VGFWDTVKGWFGTGAAPGGLPAPAGGNDPAFAAVVAAASRRVQARGMFVPMDLVDEVTGPGRSTDELRAALAAVRKLAPSGTLEAWGYVQSGQVYHPKDADPSTYFAPVAQAPRPPPAPARAQPRPPSAAPAAAPSRASTTPAPRPRPSQRFDPAAPYEASAILGFTAEQLRARALRLNPWSSPWMNRQDIIPPAGDERTALIDRGIVLHGLLNPDQLTEIHRVGDQWLRHRDAAKLAKTVAHTNAEAALEAARAEKAATKERKKREAAERRAAHVAGVAKRRAEDIIYLGRGVSTGLSDRRSNVEELAKQRLPLLASPADVAKALGLTIRELRGLCFHAEATERTHYVYFEVPKRSGGKRLLAAPHQRLAKAQRWVLQNVLAQLEVTAYAHGFVSGRSTVTNAQAHVARNLVVNLDLKDFFPTVTFPRIRGFFQSLGYSPAASTVLGLLVTESPRMAVEHDGRLLWVAIGDRALPQGACTSPALSNLVTRKLDRRLAGATKKLGWAYTRYADDLTFSTDAVHKRDLKLVLARVRHIVREEGFVVNEKKGRVQRAASRQEVTGIVVNDKLGVPREEVRRLRAILHGAKTTGLEAQNREGRGAFEAWLRGKIAYVQMVDPIRGAKLRDALNALPRRG
jgi:RNA-directed DNA polymerase